MRKVKYYQFTGKYTQEKVQLADGKTEMQDAEPIFQAYEGAVRGPFKLIKPPKLDAQGKILEQPQLEFYPAVYEVSIATGSWFRNLKKEAWHLEVNFGTEWLPRLASIENALEKKNRQHVEQPYFEFVEEAPATAAEPAKTDPAKKGK